MRQSIIPEMTSFQATYQRASSLVGGLSPPFTTGLHTVQQPRKWGGCSAEHDITSLLLETETELLISPPNDSSASHLKKKTKNNPSLKD